MEEEYLYKKLNVLEEVGALKDIPNIINSGINKNIILREYQKKAFQYFITYFETQELRKNKQIHTLFHMATGSGKTIIMAGLVLYLYTKGYRKFLFFVNQSNIVEKTKDNFINSRSSKYLFDENLEYMGNKLKINIVNNFSENEDIEICFTTTQKLHLDLISSKENSLTYDDFENNKIVFLSDESHHINSLTKKPTQEEKEAINSWEYSVMNAFRSNKDNILLEFTATADLNDMNVKQKYKDKIIFDYPLQKFRESGYTKDFQNFATESDLWNRSLMAIILSEYRKYLFADLKLNIKPVVMMKSQRINDSNEFYNLFFYNMQNLTSYEILDLYKANIELLTQALDYFKFKDESFELLEHSLKNSFTKDTAIIMNDKNKDNTKEKQLLVNSLEDKQNPIRIIFTVDMLNEGWDVLNLFDIVRLYDTRQGSGKAGKIGNYTIKEAQLIGRGARYCPFDLGNQQDKFKRKYDNDLGNRNRILETMLFHSRNDSKYIAELKQALVQTGLEPEQPIKLDYKLKDNFKETDFYKNSYVYTNRRVVKDRKNIKDIESSFKTKVYSYIVKTNQGKTLSLFDDSDKQNNLTINTKSYKFKDIDYNILLGASERFCELKFNIIKNRYPNVKTIKEFLTSENYLGNNLIEVTYSSEITGKELRNACVKALNDIAQHITEIKSEFEGTKEFTPLPLRKVLKDKSIYLSNIEGNGGRGDSQNNCINEEYRTDLTNDDWYVFNDNYGTSEEKKFIKFFKLNIVPKLVEKELEFYVVRNERNPELAIYSFKDGERFEPDYLLFIRRKQNNNFNIHQIYAEPKGNQLLLQDKWKEDFLLEIKDNVELDSRFLDGNNYKIFGLPFYNEEFKKEEFEESLDEIIDNI